MPATEDRHNDLERSLTNVTPNERVIENIEYLRQAAKNYGHAVLDLVPASRAQSLALTKLEESVMWAVKALVLTSED